MNKYRVIGGILLSMVSGILLAFTQYWFLVFIPLFFIGAFLSMNKKESFLFGLFSALGMVVQVADSLVHCKIHYHALSS